MSRRIIGPFNRVEGDLEVTIESLDGKVIDAQVNASLFRGFEEILSGRDPFDAIAIVPRICGICSVSQSVAATRALANLMGLDMAPNGRLATELVSAAENIADHLAHFYLFFMPDFARDYYRDDPWFDDIHAAFKATKGQASAEFLKARAGIFNVVGLLAGKWPHTMAIQPGGTTQAVDAGSKMRLLSVIGGVRDFVENQMLGDRLENFSQIASVEALFRWAHEPGRAGAHFASFVRLSEALDLRSLGKRPAAFLSYGAYDGLGQGPLFPGGVWKNGVTPLDPAGIREDLAHSWMDGVSAHPTQGQTQPNADKDEAYSWCKAPRLNGEVMEVGALARQVIAKNPLALDCVADQQSNVMGRIVARMIEVALIIPAMEQWAAAFALKDPFCTTGVMPKRAQGFGLVEAARGSLGHWISVEDGHVSSYQIIAPTTWNFSPRDDQGQPGAAEQALVGASVGDAEGAPVNVQHIVRSFDPCMVCTVH